MGGISCNLHACFKERKNVWQLFFIAAELKETFVLHACMCAGLDFGELKRKKDSIASCSKKGLQNKARNCSQFPIKRSQSTA
jgi:hypothetical protein